MTDWLGLSDYAMPEDGALAPDRGAFVLDLSLPDRAAILIDHKADRSAGSQDGAARAFSISCDKSTGIEVLHRNGAAMVRHNLNCPLPTDGGPARMMLQWDLRKADWLLRLDTAGQRHEARGKHPLPIAAADARALCRQPPRHPGVNWFGITRGAPPPLRAPWIGLRTPISTPHGLRAAGSLCTGDLVHTLDGGAVPLRGAHRLDLPSCGRFTPVRLRAPYFGGQSDILVSSDQMLVLAGSEVEYLFGDEEVLVQARHLVDGRSALFDQRRASVSGVALDLGTQDLILGESSALASADLRDRSYGGARPPLPRRLLRSYEAVPLLAMLGRDTLRRGI